MNDPLQKTFLALRIHTQQKCSCRSFYFAIILIPMKIAVIMCFKLYIYMYYVKHHSRKLQRVIPQRVPVDYLC